MEISNLIEKLKQIKEYYGELDCRILDENIDNLRGLKLLEDRNELCFVSDVYMQDEEYPCQKEYVYVEEELTFNFFKHEKNK